MSANFREPRALKKIYKRWRTINPSISPDTRLDSRNRMSKSRSPPPLTLYVHINLNEKQTNVPPPPLMTAAF